MSIERHARTFALTMLLTLACCCPAEDKQPAEKPPNDPQFHKTLLSIAAGYLNYGRVDNMNRWAPTLCMSVPGTLRFSASKDSDTHGGKLYFIYAKDAEDYMQTPEKDTFHEFWPELKLLDDGGAKQVLVKQSWKAQKVTDLPKHMDPEIHAQRGGKLFKPGEQADLFIMVQFAKDKAGTDEGWIYATVSPDGKTVTSSGKVQSCMACHVDAPRHRVFGLPGVKKAKK